MYCIGGLAIAPFVHPPTRVHTLTRRHFTISYLDSLKRRCVWRCGTIVYMTISSRWKISCAISLTLLVSFVRSLSRHSSLSSTFALRYSSSSSFFYEMSHKINNAYIDSADGWSSLYNNASWRFWLVWLVQVCVDIRCSEYITSRSAFALHLYVRKYIALTLVLNTLWNWNGTHTYLFINAGFRRISLSLSLAFVCVSAFE